MHPPQRPAGMCHCQARQLPGWRPNCCLLSRLTLVSLACALQVVAGHTTQDQIHFQWPPRLLLSASDWQVPRQYCKVRALWEASSGLGIKSASGVAAAPLSYGMNLTMLDLCVLDMCPADGGQECIQRKDRHITYLPRHTRLASFSVVLR
jgi:hypothetical protein